MGFLMVSIKICPTATGYFYLKGRGGQSVRSVFIRIGHLPFNKILCGGSIRIEKEIETRKESKFILWDFEFLVSSFSIS